MYEGDYSAVGWWMKSSQVKVKKSVSLASFVSWINLVAFLNGMEFNGNNSSLNRYRMQCGDLCSFLCCIVYVIGSIFLSLVSFLRDNCIQIEIENLIHVSSQNELNWNCKWIELNWISFCWKWKEIWFDLMISLSQCMQNAVSDLCRFFFCFDRRITV